MSKLINGDTLLLLAEKPQAEKKPNQNNWDKNFSFFQGKIILSGLTEREKFRTAIFFSAPAPYLLSV